MESLSELALRCRVEGYRLGLSGEYVFSSGLVDRVLGGVAGHHPEYPWGYYSDEFQSLLRAMQVGVSDGYLAYAKASGIFLSPEQAAAAKGVATNTIHRLLRNPKRVQRFFERSASDGDGKRLVWYLHPDDVKEWLPDERGRKRIPHAG